MRSLIVALSLCCVVVSSSSEAWPSRKTCFAFVAGAAVSAAVVSEIAWQPVQNTVQRWGESWNAYQERLRVERERRAAEEAANLERLREIRKNPTLQREFLTELLAKLKEERTAMAPNASRHDIKPKWDALNARIVAVDREIKESRCADFRRRIAHTAERLADSLQYDRDKAELDNDRRQLRALELDLYRGFFGNDDLKTGKALDGLGDP